MASVITICQTGISDAGAKGGWNFAWKTMMTELAPQDAEGSYNRPKYDFVADPISSLTVASPFLRTALPKIVLR